MRKVIGIGETVLDIIFRNNQPERAVPGGSTFNCMVSLGRCNLPALFISELGNDKVGGWIRNFMQENKLSSEYIDFFEEGNSPVSLAFLDENQNAEYQFFRAFPKQRLQVPFPEINEDDVLVFGSYFAVNPSLREKIEALVCYAKARKAIIYYDINFRKAHASERNQLLPYFLKNVAEASIVRCSDEDLENLFPDETIETFYSKYILERNKIFIVTRGEKDIMLRTPLFEKTYPVKAIQAVSTIGAGDNFNAGIIYGIMKNAISADELAGLSEKQWDEWIDCGKAFAAEVCRSMENYISKDFAIAAATS